MEPEINGTSPNKQPPNHQSHPELFTPNTNSFSQFPNTHPYHYFMSPLNSMYYPQYPQYQYHNAPYGNNPYAQMPGSSWKDGSYPEKMIMPSSNFQQNMSYFQNTRVINREIKPKNPPELIVIDSEEESVKQITPKCPSQI